MRKYAEIFKGLADQTRLTMLALLLQSGELCVCDIVEVLGITQSKASRHLRILRNLGLLDDRRAGVWVHYRVRAEPDAEAEAVLRAVRGLVEGIVPADIEARMRARLETKVRVQVQGAGSCDPVPVEPKQQETNDG